MDKPITVSRKLFFEKILPSMGFVEGRGFEGEVWTNVSGLDAQVWINADEEGPRKDYEVLSDPVDLAAFYRFLREADERDRDKSSAIQDMGADW